MINLAGKTDCDKTVREELMIAKIPIIDLGASMNREVPASLIGYLNGFKFIRGWYYWMVSGYMPLEHAKYLYQNYKDLNIRVAGHCENPPPEEWSECKDYDEKTKPIFDDYINEKISYDDANAKGLEIRRLGDQFITHYHIDTQLGLCEFAGAIIRNNIQC